LNDRVALLKPDRLIVGERAQPVALPTS